MVLPSWDKEGGRKGKFRSSPTLTIKMVKNGHVLPSSTFLHLDGEEKKKKGRGECP